MVDSDGTIPVFVSYAWDDERESGIVSGLEDACNKDGVLRVIRDVHKLKYGDSITKYMDDLGAGLWVIAMVSQRFLKSAYCMYEMLQVQENGELGGRLFPVVLGDVSLSEPLDRLKWVKYWKDYTAEFQSEWKEIDQTDCDGQYADLQRLKEISGSVSKLMQFIADHNNLTQEDHVDGGFVDVIERIRRCALNNPSPQINGITHSEICEGSGTVGGVDGEKAAVSITHTPVNCAEICKEVGKILQRDELGEFLPFLRKEGEDEAQLIDILCGPPPDEAISRLNRALQGLLNARRDVQKPHFRETMEQLAGWVALRAVDQNKLEPVIQGLSAGERARATVEIRDSVGVEIIVSFAQGREPEFKAGGESGVRGRRWVDTRLRKPDMGPEPQLEEQIAMVYDQVLRKQRGYPADLHPDEEEQNALDLHMKAMVDDREGAYYATGSLIGLKEDEQGRVDHRCRDLQGKLGYLKIVLTGGTKGTGDLVPSSNALASHVTNLYKKLERIDGGNQKHE